MGMWVLVLLLCTDVNVASCQMGHGPVVYTEKEPCDGRLAQIRQQAMNDPDVAFFAGFCEEVKLPTKGA